MALRKRKEVKTFLKSEVFQLVTRRAVVAKVAEQIIKVA
jgi:hypothetical protein